MNEENNDNIAVAVNELFTADDLKTNTVLNKFPKNIILR